MRSQKTHPKHLIGLRLVVLTSLLTLSWFCWGWPLSDLANKVYSSNNAHQPVSTSVQHQPDQASQARVSEAYGKLPLSFEANHGQTNPAVRFISRGSGYSLPVIYQEVAGSRKEIAGSYVVKANREIGFEIGSYDLSLPLVSAVETPLPFGAEPTTIGLVAYYKFDEGSGTTAADSSGNSLNGQYGGNWINTDLPDIGFENLNALSFNGTSNFVYCPPAVINDLSAGTITAWVYLNTRDQEVITAKQQNNVNSMAIFSVGLSGASSGGSDIQTPGVLYFHAKNFTVNAAGVTPLNTGQWYHVGVTFTAAQAKIYVNGILDSTTNGDFSIPNLNAPTIIGAWLGDGLLDGRETNYLNGRLDEVRIYDRPLSDLEMRDFVTSSEFSASAIVANKGGNSGDVSVSVLGGGYQPGTTVKLKTFGQPDIEGANPIVVNRSRITTTFILRGATPGLRDVVVILPDGRTATLPDGFTIEEGGSAQVWVDVIGRDTIRVGRPQTYNIIYGNRGNIDAVGVPVWIGGIPKDAALTVGFEVTAPIPLEGQGPKDWSQIPIHVETNDEKLLPLFVPIVPPGSTGVLRISLTVPTQREFQLRAWVNPLYFQSPINPQVVDCGLALGNVVLEAIGIIPGVGCGVAITTASAQSFITAVQFGRDLPSAGTSTVVFSLVQVHTNAISKVTSIAEACGAGEIPVFGAIVASVQIHLAAIDAYDQCNEPFRKLGETITPLIRTIASLDPNDKVGSFGAGSLRYLSGKEPLRYSIYFENVETATAPAQDIVIIDQLDITKLDLDTFSFGPIAFGNKLITPLPNLSEFNQDVDLRPANNLIVRVNAGLDKNTGLLTWRFTSIDPATGLPPEDPLAGFLPPNITPPEGDGSVLFTVMPKQGLATGTEIRNQARIIFDANAPIDTPQWFNTLDNAEPSSNVLSLPAVQSSASFQIQWQGTDVGAGVLDYTISVSENGGSFTPWLRNTPATSGTFTGQPGRTYAFFSVARDRTGNTEAAPPTADATTQVSSQATSANLAITKMASPNPVTTGSNITYTIRVTNNGPSVATSVMVTDNLPAATTYVSCSATGGGVCGGAGNNRTVTFASLVSGASATITLVATANCAVANGTVISNTATVSSSTPDPDSTNNNAAVTTTASNPPPTITGTSASPSELWPPNHKMVDVTVNYTTTDNCGPLTCTLSVTSNEPINGTGDGDTASDWEIVDAHHVRLRAERSDSGTGRTYTITITCRDSAGNAWTKTVTVKVPLNRS